MELNAKMINDKRKELGITQKELADIIGVSYQTIQNWESGKTIPKSKYQILGNFLEKVKNHSEYKIQQPKESTVNEPPTGYYYPDVSASAGLENQLVNDELKRVIINIPNFEKGIEFINVYGDSMYPKFCSGEIIGIKEVEPCYINFGYAYVIILNDGQVFLKYIRKGKDDDHWLLASENPKYEAKEFHLSLLKRFFIIKGVITKTTM
jgi:phage repressor protein C with HTH and peptisase S24 domain